MIIQNVYFLHIIIFQNIGDIDMDFGDAQQECINKGSEPATLKGAENSPSFSQHNDVEAVISHKKPKKYANLNVIAQGILFNVIIDLSFIIFPFVFSQFVSF